MSDTSSSASGQSPSLSGQANSLSGQSPSALLGADDEAGATAEGLSARAQARILATLSEEISARPSQVSAAVGLLDEGATVPFIARYRKEVTCPLYTSDAADELTRVVSRVLPVIERNNTIRTVARQ